MKTIYETLKKQDVSTGFESNDAAADGTNNGEDGAMF
jgi:hypothetical protein